MTATNLFKPIYETNEDISRLLGEIDSLESLISASALFRDFLRQSWQEWRQESVCSAFRFQRWGLEPDEVTAYLNGNLIENSGAARVQVRIKNYAAVLDYLRNLQPTAELALADLSAIHNQLRSGVGEGDIFAGQIRTRFTAIYKPNGRDVKFYLPSPRDLDGYLKALLDWLNAHDHNSHAFVRAAIAHHRLLELRPFQQDNGKVARLFFRRTVVSNLFPWRSLLPYESIFAKDRVRYYHLLDSYDHPHMRFEERTSPKLTEWITYHLEGISDLLNVFLEHLSSHVPLRHPIDTLNTRQRNALKYVKRNGYISNREYRDRNGVGRYTAFCELRDLVDKKFLIPSCTRGRSVVYYDPSK